MSGPGDRATKFATTGEPTPSLAAEGQGAGPSSMDVVPSLPSGSWSSARAHQPHAREPGDLGESLTVSTDGKSREGEQPQSAEVISEESDAVVVPKKAAKTWVTPVESLEGRTSAKGKSAARNASSSQHESDALTQLRWIGERARSRPEEQFTNLLSHIKRPLLREAYKRLSKHAAAGVDGVTWHEYGERLDDRLLDLEDRVQRGSYHPQPVRRVHIPKGDGSTRPLGIPALEDKIVQQAARMVLEPIYESMFIGFSYGFRSRKSHHDALDALAVAIERQVNWVLDADIRSFFDTIDHGWMQQFVERRIGDRRMVRLLMKWMNAGVMEEDELHEVEAGTPQGGIISPLLANIFLHYVLDLWVCQWRKTHARGVVYVVRYADDFVMGFEYEEDARAMHAALTARLREHALELHPVKTRVIEFGRYARERRERAGLPKPETFDFLGFTHIASRDRRGRFQLKRRTSRKKRRVKLAAIKEECRRRRHHDVTEQHRWLSKVLNGHFNYYAVPTNYRMLQGYRECVRSTWHRSLQRRSQRASWTSEVRRVFDKRFPLPIPNIRHPWPSERFAHR